MTSTKLRPMHQQLVINPGDIPSPRYSSIHRIISFSSGLIKGKEGMKDVVYSPSMRLWVVAK